MSRSEPPAGRDASYPVTPDGRYFVVRGGCGGCRILRWKRGSGKTRAKADAGEGRCRAGGGNDADLARRARRRVNEAKVALGERGPVVGRRPPDYNRQMAVNTPYGQWFTSLPRM